MAKFIAKVGQVPLSFSLSKTAKNEALSATLEDGKEYELPENDKYIKGLVRQGKLVLSSTISETKKEEKV